MTHPSLRAGNVAVITGAGFGGIGYSTAHLLLTTYKLQVLLVDISSSSLAQASAALIAAGAPSESVHTRVVDVSQSAQMFELADFVFSKFGKVDFLMLNAGVQMKTVDYKEGGDLESWNKTLGVNFYGVLHGTQAFVDRIVKQGTDAAIVITGSKQGITQPPGNPAYNVSKSAVKSLAESLAHSLLPTKVSVHLLVPGYTYTKLTNGGGDPNPATVPKAAWTTEQVAQYLFSKINVDGPSFYIICPDNDVNWTLDSARMAWNADDIQKGRPALSRWNPAYAAEFAQFVAERTNI